MQRLAILITFLLAAAGAWAQTNKFDKEILAFEASDRTNPPPKNAVLFIGSSSIRYWTNLAGDFPKHKVINRGFGGSEIGDSLHFFDRIVVPYKPRLIVMYAGGNDIHYGKSPQHVFEDFRAFIAKTRAALPNTRVAYISIAPNPARWGEVEKVREANRLIAAYVRGRRRLEYIDTFSHMLGPDGLPRPEIYRADRLHMNERGYELWRGIVKWHL